MPATTAEVSLEEYLNTSYNPDCDYIDGVKPYARGKVVVNIPIIVVEIKSPDDTLDDILERCLDYAALGVANIAVLDPDKRRRLHIQIQLRAQSPTVSNPLIQ